jgi:hypothetical protein
VTENGGEMKKNDLRSSVMIVHKGRTVIAIYRKSEISDYQGNPLIEALPPILTSEHSISRLAFYPLYDESYRNAPDHVRRHLIQSGMRFFAPLDIHVDLERRISCLIRMGYISRNPIDKSLWTKVASKLDFLDQYGYQNGDEQDDPSWTATGFSVVGMSGIGKSRSTLRILNLYPQVIHHNNYKSRDFTHSQLVWLKLECPHDGNPRGLCIQFFKAVDSILGTTYYHNYGNRRRIQDELLSDMATIAANHFIGILVIDEIQRLSLAKSGGADKMLNFFVQLINTIGVPVMLIGTYKAMAVLSGEFSQMRRGTGQGDLIWDRMDNDEQWKLLLESLWRFQYTKKQCSLTTELSDTLYEETQGITDFAVKVYMFAQERAIDSGKETITPAIIRSVAKDKLGLPREVLNALKLGDKRILSRFEDVYPTALRKYLSELPESVQVTGKIESAPDVKATIESFFNTKQDIPSSLPEQKLDTEVKPLNSVGDESTNGGHYSKKQRGLSPSSTKGELPKIVAALEKKDGLSAYEALRQAGYIRSANEYLGS